MAGKGRRRQHLKAAVSAAHSGTLWTVAFFSFTLWIWRCMPSKPSSASHGSDIMSAASKARGRCGPLFHRRRSVPPQCSR
eukprot:scaffold1097_cov246-Pinguiococcus_pyrenoidosus.AAC.1